jgi:glycosyltransferase involved in cell wall biosynthesis
MTMLSLVMPFYLNRSMLELQMREWLRWSPKAKAQIEIIIVDDGSPDPALDVALPGLTECDRPVISIYRIAEDRPWHQHAARNLGAHVAKGPWLLLTDMDHVLTATNADALLKRLARLDLGTAYFLHRIEASTGLPTMANDGITPKPHPNSFVMTRDLYWKAGGYDEDFCGIYGTDGLFKSRLFTLAEQGHLAKVALTRYWREIVADASTTTLQRKEGRKPGEKEAVALRKIAEGREGQITTLNFPWERVL